MKRKKAQKINLKKILHLAFIPSHKNSHRPHAFRHFMLSVYSVALVLSHLSFGAVQYTPLAIEPGQLKEDILTKINNERKKSSKKTFTENPLLASAAEEKLKDMFEKNYWDHISPSGEKAWVFINNTGYSYTVAGENLARGFVSADSMVGAWMDSPTHKKNILDENFTETGVAVGNGIIDGRSATVAVQLFGAPSREFAQGSTLVAGERSVSPAFSLGSPVSAANMPFFVIYLIIFGLVVFDGVMIRLNKAHKNSRHMLSFRTSLGLNILVLGVLCLNITRIF